MAQRQGDRRRSRSFFSVIPACITFSVLTAGPAAAATLSLAETTLVFENFSHAPTQVFSATDTWTYTFARDGQVSAIAQANASFSEPDGSSENVSGPIVHHTASVLIQGEGRVIYGFGRGVATTLGQNFVIGAEESFSFDFTSTVNLLASNTDSGNVSAGGRATATGNSVLRLYEQIETGEWVLLETFSLLNSLNSRANSSSLSFAATENVTLEDQQIDWSYGSTRNEKAFSSVTQGRVVKTFQDQTQLMLIGHTYAEGTMGVPEPSPVGALIFLGLVSLCLRRRVIQ